MTISPNDTLVILLSLSRQLAEAQRKIDAQTKALYNCSQIAGKVLGYPWFKDDQKNFPGATEADGVCIGEHVAETIVEELARQCDDYREMWESNAAATAAATNRALIAEERLAEAQRGVTKAMRAILEAAFAVQSRTASSVDEEAVIKVGCTAWFAARVRRGLDPEQQQCSYPNCTCTQTPTIVRAVLSRKKPEHTAAMGTTDE